MGLFLGDLIQFWAREGERLIIDHYSRWVFIRGLVLITFSTHFQNF